MKHLATSWRHPGWQIMEADIAPDISTWVMPSLDPVFFIEIFFLHIYVSYNFISNDVGMYVRVFDIKISKSFVTELNLKVSDNVNIFQVSPHFLSEWIFVDVIFLFNVLLFVGELHILCEVPCSLLEVMVFIVLFLCYAQSFVALT